MGFCLYTLWRFWIALGVPLQLILLPIIQFSRILSGASPNRGSNSSNQAASGCGAIITTRAILTPCPLLLTVSDRPNLSYPSSRLWFNLKAYIQPVGTSSQDPLHINIK